MVVSIWIETTFFYEVSQFLVENLRGLFVYLFGKIV